MLRYTYIACFVLSVINMYVSCFTTLCYFVHAHYVCGTALQIGRSLVRFQMVSLEFFIHIILPIALWPWGRLSL
jgi:hypothetical protein